MYGYIKSTDKAGVQGPFSEVLELVFVSLFLDLVHLGSLRSVHRELIMSQVIHFIGVNGLGGLFVYFVVLLLLEFGLIL